MSNVILSQNGSIVCFIYGSVSSSSLCDDTNSGVPCEDCCCAGCAKSPGVSDVGVVVGNGTVLSCELEAVGSCEGPSSSLQ